MADIEQLSRALLAADKAGDTQSAQLLANEIRKLQGSQQQTEPTQADAEVDTSLSGAVSLWCRPSWCHGRQRYPVSW